MWKSKSLRIENSAGKVVCSTLCVNPWTPGAGRRELSGVYLSPGNAVEWVARKLAGVSSLMDVTAMLITAPTLAGFIAELAALAEVFPLPDITALHRRASTAATLEASKMQIPAISNGLPAPGPLSVSTLRSVGSAAALLDAAEGAGNVLSARLAAFKKQRAEIIAEARGALSSVAGKSARVHAISVERNALGAVRAMRDGIPHPDHVFAVCLVFVGEDLAPLRGMLHDE